MVYLKKFSFITICLSIFFLSCKKSSRRIENLEKENLTKELNVSNVTNEQKETFKNQVKENIATIDYESIDEIKDSFEKELPTIYDYYKLDNSDQYKNWSKKLFGRCCSNTDIQFTENLFLKYSTTVNNANYPISNIFDKDYLTAFVFQPESNVKINIYLDKENSFLKGEYSNKKLLTSDEVLMDPIKISLINGYVKNKDLFYKNGRVKDLDIEVNNKFVKTITLLDTPLIQKIVVSSKFRTNDHITLIPKTYYHGTKYTDICISEIQSNLGKTGLNSLNSKFNLIELMNAKK